MLQFRKNFLSVVTTAAIILAAFGSIGSQSANSTAIGKINFILGKEFEVTIRHESGAKWFPVRLKMDIRRGDRIKTAKETRCEIKLNDGSVIRIGENSEFDFQQSNLSKSTRQVEAGLSIGKIWAVVTKWVNSKDQFAVKSPTAVCAVRGTIYRMEADSTTRVAVYDGQVDVGPTDDLRQQLQQQPRPLGPPQRIPGPTQIPGPYQVTLDQWVQLVQGYQLEVRSNGRYAKTKIDSTAEAQVDWVRWNKERDRLLR
jgi:hypothetical protein